MSTPINCGRLPKGLGLDERLFIAVRYALFDIRLFRLFVCTDLSYGLFMLLLLLLFLHCRRLLAAGEGNRSVFRLRSTLFVLSFVGSLPTVLLRRL